MITDYLKIEQKPLPSNCYKTRPSGAVVKYIIIHDIKYDLKETIDIFTKEKLSSHYYIDRNGRIYQFVHDDLLANHAGQSQFKSDVGLNQSSIGIELQGSYEHQFTNEQISSISALLKILEDKYDIEKSNVLSHAEIAPYRIINDTPQPGKIDPGLHFPWRLLSDTGVCYHHDCTIKQNPEMLYKYNDSGESILNIQEKLYSLGYSYINCNGIYDLKTASVLNAFYLRYYQLWFLINQEVIRDQLIKAATKKNSGSLELEAFQNDTINDMWLFGEDYYLYLSNIDENTIMILDEMTNQSC
ncbi:MAG: N-acetylmuramoyl-L-alanine amidase [Rickettsiaceae bacterium]|nr:N-acetylmuramoyl-L-alanine amidase [Rickettsiaceae bacterium]